MENKQKEMSYIESTIAHVSQENHRRGIHIWLDANEDGEGVSLSMNHNFNDDEGNAKLEDVIQVLEDVMKYVKLLAASEPPKIAEFTRFIEMLKAGEGDE